MPIIAGIDISRRQVRAAYVQSTFRSSEVIGYDRQDILPTETGLQHAIAALLQQAPKKPDLIVAGLSGTRTCLHLLQLPKAVLQQAQAVLASELETLVPFSLNDAVIDHQVVEQDKKLVRLWAVAANTKDILSRVSELESSGLEPHSIVPQSLALSALAAAAPGLFVDQMVALLDMRDNETDLCVLAGGIPQLCQTLSAGLQQVQQGQRKQLSDQLVRALTGYRATTDRAIDCAILTGAAVNMAGALKWLEDELGLPCRTFDIPSPTGDAMMGPPECGSALALAMYAAQKKHSINLRQGVLALASPVGSARELIEKAAIGIAAILGCTYATLVGDLVLAKKQRTLAESRLGEQTAQIWGVSVKNAEEAQALITGGPSQGDPMPDDDAFEILSWISSAIPSDVKHDTRRLLIEHSQDGKQTRGELNGIVDSISQRDSIVSALKAQTCIASVEAGSITPSQDNRQNYQLDFTVQCGAQPKVANEGKTP